MSINNYMNSNIGHFEPIRQYIIKKFTSKNPLRFKRTLNDVRYYDENILNDIYNLTTFLEKGTSFKERIHCILNGVNEQPRCLYCGKKCNLANINGRLYYRVHCKNCAVHHTAVLNTGRMQSNEEKIKRANSIRGITRSFETRKKLSLSIKKSFGSKTLKRLEYNKRRYDKAHRESQSKKLKEKIKNGTWTPLATNSWACSRVDYNGIAYRSAWEALFAFLFPLLKYENIRIPYIENNINRIYITDFCDVKNKILYEIKPKSNINNKNFSLKVQFANKWCGENGYKYVVVDEDWIKKYIKNNNILFDSMPDNFRKKVKQFYD